MTCENNYLANLNDFVWFKMTVFAGIYDRCTFRGDYNTKDHENK